MKILVNVGVPAIGENFDVLIPDFLRVEEVVDLLVTAVREAGTHAYVSSGHEFLCFVEKDVLMKEDDEFRHYGVRNGDHLLLI
jgi:uncharacterized ubiquitin-like protein YukD